MPTLRLTRSTMLLVITPLLALSACQPATPDVSGPAVTAAETDQADPTTAIPEVTSEQPAIIDVTFGSGPFSLNEPSIGLSELRSYRATLTLSFDGALDGQADQWSRTYVMLADNERSARQLTIEMAGDAPDQVFMAELNGAHYERQGDESCIASVIAEESSLALWWEPASFLSAVIGADEAGSETVNGVPAEHYTFDQRALGLADFTSSTGEVWVASDGGYVVKYVLVTEAGADYFGEGSEGALSWVYDLTDANLPAAIELPVDCPAGMIDAPLLPDAAIVLNVPGLLSYTTPASLEDAAAFYEVELPALGWQPVASPGIAETSVMLDFAQGDQQLSVIITAAGALTTIRLVLRRVIIP